MNTFKNEKIVTINIWKEVNYNDFKSKKEIHEYGEKLAEEVGGDYNGFLVEYRYTGEGRYVPENEKYEMLLKHFDDLIKIYSDSSSEYSKIIVHELRLVKDGFEGIMK